MIWLCTSCVDGREERHSCGYGDYLKACYLGMLLWVGVILGVGAGMGGCGRPSIGGRTATTHNSKY